MMNYPINGRTCTIASPKLIYIIVDAAQFAALPGAGHEAEKMYWKDTKLSGITVVFQLPKPPETYYFPCQQCNVMIEIAPYQICPECGSFHTAVQVERQLEKMLEGAAA